MAKVEAYYKELRMQVKVIGQYDIKIVSDLYCKGNIEPEYTYIDLNGRIEMAKQGDINQDILNCSIEIKEIQEEKDAINGYVVLEKYKPKYDLLFGSLKFEKDYIKEDIIQGNCSYISSVIQDINSYLSIQKDQYIYDLQTRLKYLQTKINSEDIYSMIRIEKEYIKEDIIQGSLNYESQLLINDIKGSLTVKEDQYIYELYGKGIIEKEGIINEDIIGETNIEKEDFSQDIIQGQGKVFSYYKALEFPCSIEVKLLKLNQDIWCKIKIPEEIKKDIYCEIVVDAENYFDMFVLNGKTNIEKESYDEEFFDISFELLPQSYIDLDCSANIEAFYTRKDFNTSITVPENYSLDIIEGNCKLISFDDDLDYYFCDWEESHIMPIVSEEDISKLFNLDYPHKKYHHHHHKHLERILLHPYSYDLNISLLVENKNEIKICNPVQRARIVIIVSPFWHYSAYVLKSTLVTFFERYYHKFDFSIVYGGSTRADWDITNLALNFNIPAYKLIRVPVEEGCIQKGSTPCYDIFVENMLHQMFNFFPNEPQIISRVFIFCNRPNYVYSDPISKIVKVCKQNQISTVLIAPDGDYKEISEIDSNYDAARQNLEMQRAVEKRFPSRGYKMINNFFENDPNDITY